MNSKSSRGLQFVVLAAGFSARLGQSKALAQVRGMSLLHTTLQLLAVLKAGPITVVAPPKSASFKRACQGIGAFQGIRVTIVVNSQRAEGLSSSVRRGIASAGHSAGLLLLPVDLVNLKHSELSRLISRWRATPRRVIARRVGEKGGTPLILPRWLYARALGSRGDVGLRDMLADLPSESRVLLDMPSAAMDVDTPHDLHAARRPRRITGKYGTTPEIR